MYNTGCSSEGVANTTLWDRKLEQKCYPLIGICVYLFGRIIENYFGTVVVT